VSRRSFALVFVTALAIGGFVVIGASVTRTLTTTDQLRVTPRPSVACDDLTAGSAVIPRNLDVTGCLLPDGGRQRPTARRCRDGRELFGTALWWGFTGQQSRSILADGALDAYDAAYRAC